MTPVIELVFTVCLVASPTTCQDKVMVFMERGLTKARCSRGAQMHLAKWKAQHPKWKVGKHHCRFQGEEEREA